jgi:drug/metabolite transporter (DMT)-like permease
MRPGWPTREAATYNGLRALLIVVTATSFFFALGRLPLADAIARIEAARLAPITYVTLVWGVVFGFLFFAEVPGLATILGAALIVLGTLVTQRR